MKTLIVIDDHTENLDAMKFYFGRRKEFKVLYSTSAEEGFELILKYRPQIVLLDYQIPPYTGEQVLDWINEHNLPVKVIFVTGKSNDRDLKNRLLSKGAYAVVGKGGIDDVEEMAEKIGEVLGKPI